ncbi:hypothetical protein NDU88_004533 [Pleurodeles waltl]|uniref:Uncharacterized protein n=1 Tax=Pleurodeles waltl TaxID=8319 RepID=A0AAV7M7D1_PLEWA|nr:hypothetical protein NDU88_004533 [Pleurodeles waltl]
MLWARELPGRRAFSHKSSGCTPLRQYGGRLLAMKETSREEKTTRQCDSSHLPLFDLAHIPVQRQTQVHTGAHPVKDVFRR